MSIPLQVRTIISEKFTRIDALPQTTRIKSNPVMITSWLIKILGAILFTLILFIPSAEYILRNQCTYCSEPEKRSLPFQSIYKSNPDQSWYFHRPPNRESSHHTSEYSYTLTTNSIGLRGEAFSVEKPENEYRIITLGDSFTEGVGVSDENTYPYFLEAFLNQTNGPMKYRVMNGGVASSDPFFGYALLRDKLIKYRPDLVTITINDSDINDIILRTGEERFLDNGKVQFRQAPETEWYFERSHLVRYFVIDILNYNEYYFSHSDWEIYRIEAFQNLKNIVGKLQDLSKKERFKLLVIFHPTTYDITKPRRYGFPAKDLKQFMRRSGVYFFDLMGPLAEKIDSDSESLNSLYFRQDRHHTPRGNQVFAEILGGHLLKQSLIPD